MYKLSVIGAIITGAAIIHQDHFISIWIGHWSHTTGIS